MNSQIVLCGRGGQGVLFLTRILDEAAVISGFNVISSETHGMAMRGGSVASYVRIGAYAAPLIMSGQADCMLSLSEHEASLYRHLLKKNGIVFLNSHARHKTAVDASRIAENLGSYVSTNLVLLGYACAHTDFPLSFAIVRDALEKLSPPRYYDINLRALTEGCNAA